MTSTKNNENLIWYKNKRGDLRYMENGVKDKMPNTFTKGRVVYLQAQLQSAN